MTAVQENTYRTQNVIHYSINEFDRRLADGFPPELSKQSVLQLQAISFPLQRFNLHCQVAATKQKIGGHQHGFVAAKPRVATSPQARQVQSQQPFPCAFATQRRGPHNGIQPRANLRDPRNRSINHHQPDSRRGRPDMATMSIQDRAPRPRNLSPADIGLLAERAGRRNASREFNLQNLNTPDTLQSHLPQNAFGIQSTTSPLAMMHYFQQSYRTDPLPCTPTPKSSRNLHVSRSRTVDRGLGYDPGLSSNMPSQITRQALQETAAAARVHADRVRSMQISLAADPNIMAQAPDAATQLTAQGPPLTGHNTTSTTTLPSVLQPYSRTPMMTYAQALQAILAETGSLHMLLRLELLEPAPVTVLLHDDMNRSLGVSEDLVLTKTTDLKTLVNLVQSLLDAEISTMPGNDRSRFLLTHIEVRNGSDEMRRGHPALKGECRGGDKVKAAAFIRWIVNGDMEMYWKVYRIVLQTQAPQAGDKMPAVKPIFSVRTVRQLMDSNHAQRPGHEFVDVLSMISGSAAVQNVDKGEENRSGHGDTSSATSSRGDKSAVTRRVIAQLQCGSEGTEPKTSSAYNASSSKGGHSPKSSKAANPPEHGGDLGPLTSSFPTNNGFSNSSDSRSNDGNNSKTSEGKGKGGAIDPTRNWGYYQRMGGNPENHRKYDLSHVPFEVKDFAATNIVFNPTLEQEIIARIQAEGWNYEATRGSNSKAPAGPDPIVYSAEEQAWRDKAVKDFEAAISFEDDDSFFPSYDTQIPNARKIAASRVLEDKKHTAKGNNEEAQAKNFLNGRGVPKSGQDHLIMKDFGSQNTGMAGTTDGNAIFSVYAGAQGGQGDMVDGGSAGFEIHNGDGGNATQTDSKLQGICAAFDPSQAHIDRIVSRYASTFNYAPASIRPPLAKVSSMNVHAPEYRSNDAVLSPYLQSLAGHSAAYTQSISFAHVRRNSSIAPNAVMFAHEGFNMFSRPNFQPQQSSPSVPNTPSKQYSVEGRVIPVSQYNPSQNTLVNRTPGRPNSPEKKLFTSTGDTSRLQSPYMKLAQNGRAYSPRRRSPEKLGPMGNDSLSFASYPSSDRAKTQQGQVGGFQYGHTYDAAQIWSTVPLNEPIAYNDSVSNFQYGLNERSSFDFQYKDQEPASNDG